MEGPKFNQVWNDIQAKMGEKPVEPRQAKKSLDKDDFLKIMISQMKFQDPTKPFDADKMMGEVASITSVEQLANVNRTLTAMSKQNRPMENLGMTHLIGKVVTIDKSRFPHIENEPDSVSFQLPQDSAETTVTITDAMGEPIFEKNLGMQGAGNVAFVWDGHRANHTPAKAGVYQIKVTAKGPQGQPIPIQMQGKVPVIGVAFEGDDAVLLVGDANHQEKIKLDQVIRVETTESAVGAAKTAALPMPAAVGGPPPEMLRQIQQQMQRQMGGPAPTSPPAAMAAARPAPQPVPQRFANMTGDDPDINLPLKQAAMASAKAAAPDAADASGEERMARKVAEIANKPNFMPIDNQMRKAQNQNDQGGFSSVAPGLMSANKK